MLVSLQWLRELVSVEPACLEPGHLAERLSIAGFEVEGIEDLAARAAGVVVGYVERRDPHPNADKLSVCQVAVGDAEPLQIVCGAANVRQGLHVPVALVGSTLPAVGLTIKPAELRGVASSGMICSLRELGLDDGSDGIAELDQLLAAVPPVGTAVGPLLGLDDQVLELAITANRPDGLSMRGIAREVAALSGGSTTFPAAAPVVAAEPLAAAAAARAAIEAGGLFSLTALRGLRVGPSPDWLRQRLERAGVRPINNVVDITNLVMLETGQPLHAFDRDRLGALTGGTPEPARIGLRQGRPHAVARNHAVKRHSIGEPETAAQLFEPHPLRPVAVAIETPSCRRQCSAGSHEQVDALAMNELSGRDESYDAIGWPARSGGEWWHVEEVAKRHDLLFRKPDPAEELAAHSANRQHECKPSCPAGGERPAPQPLQPAGLPRLFGGLRKDRETGRCWGEPMEGGPDQRVRKETGKHMQRRGRGVRREGGVVGWY
jgi:tRNA-binding EMAP/Myf-like protein